jgi:microcompartment protein CcmL/EutN
VRDDLRRPGAVDAMVKMAQVRILAADPIRRAH